MTGRHTDLVLLTRSLGYGGAETQLVRLAVALAGRGYRVHVLVFYGGGPLAAPLEAAGVPITALGKRSRWHVAGFLAGLLATLRQLAPRVVYSFLGTSNVLAALLVPCVPGARLVWSVRASNMDLARYGWLDRWQFRLERMLSRIPARIVVNSRAGARYAAAQGFPAARMQIVFNGIDTARYAPDAARRAATRRAWGIADDELLIGLVGRLDPMKGHAVFLEAAAAMSRPDVRFVCVGDGPATRVAALHAEAGARGLGARFTLLPAQAETAAVFDALDVCTSASTFGEGFPNVVGEAMACGVPCVVSDVGDSAFIVGDTGLVVAPGDAAALAAAWTTLLGESAAARRRRGEQARERIVANFALDRLVEDTIAALGLTGGIAT
ncbi:MAG: glycosyltransferase [Gammaproteobacteria bacterium]|nr:glycosyltransferase [Gammaproteobacteria bacterium]